MANNSNDPFGFGDLEDDLSAVPTKAVNPKFARKTYTCESCNGTGLWEHGRRNQHGNAKCNTCHGRGQLVSSPADRMAAKQRNLAKQQANSEQSRAANTVALSGADRLEVLAKASAWSDFARSLYEWHNAGKALSGAQLSAANNMIDKLLAKDTTRQAQAEAKVAAAPVVDLSPILAMFQAAQASGYKKPMYRAENLRIKLGKAGSLYVMTEDRMQWGTYGEQPAYEGKIADGKFFAARDAADDTLDRLLTIAADPKGAAVRYGQRTGTCSCCGRELTKHASIEAGIGPICAQKWSL